MKHWWKVLGILLLLAASTAALRVPLAPALVYVTPDRIKAGATTLDIIGYNTRFVDGGVNVVLDNDLQYVCASTVQVASSTHLTATFYVPPGFRKELTTVSAITREQVFYLHEALWTEDRGSGIVEPPWSGIKADDWDAEQPFTFPNRSILYESIRNLHFHVPMWFAMIALMGISVVYSIMALAKNSLAHDRAALSAVNVGLLFCALGLITGALWARATWGAFWTNDVKLNGAAVTALIYLAYLVLRGSVADAHKRARLAGIYNIFAFVMLVLFLFVVPRLNAVDSLHPGNGGNSPFSDLDLDDRLRAVFYPAVLGWILLGTWMFTLRNRAARLAEQLDR